MNRGLQTFRRALVSMFSHDVMGSAKAAAFSAMLFLFPTILVLTTLIALSPASDTLRGEVRAGLADLLPPDTITLLQIYFTTKKARSEQAVVSAIAVSLFAAMGVMLWLMEGFRRAYGLPRRDWSFWIERLIAVAMIPCCLVPMGCATVLVAFGHQIEVWVISNTDHAIGKYVLLAWRFLRWSIGISTTVLVLTFIYHFGSSRRSHWKHVLPGALGAATIWFLATLGFGFYLTRFADYSVIYGPLGAVVATLVWLYIASLSVLFGAEVNAQFFPKMERAPRKSALEPAAASADGPS